MMEGNEEVRKEVDESKLEVVYVWGYLPGVLPEKSPILSPMPVRVDGDEWKDVCGGGCGFAMAISESGKLITWGSADDEGQSYLTSGKHGETPEAFPLPTEVPVVKASSGWAHCVSVTEEGEVYTWGWKECIPSVKVINDFAAKDPTGKQNTSYSEEASPKSQGSDVTGSSVSYSDSKTAGEETGKRRKTSSKQEIESPVNDESFVASPCLVSLGPGVRISTVAAGGRHTLALSDMGQVWGWGYGGEGQLGLGSRAKIVSSPHIIRCIEPAGYGKDGSTVAHQGSISSSVCKVPGSYVKGIACGGRHSAVITDAGALLTFGWGLYGQCGQGNTNDQLRPTCVSSLLGISVERIAAGLWHTVCVSAEGRMYAFGGNQFGQLGTGAEHGETQPRLLDAPVLENKCAKIVSCGARHSSMLTDDGELFCWGWNKYGQLGLGDSIDRNVPSQVGVDGSLLKNVACGWWHTSLLAETTVPNI